MPDTSQKEAAEAYVAANLNVLCTELLNVDSKKNDPSKAVYTQALNTAIHARKLRDMCALYVGDFAAFNEALRLVHKSAMSVCAE